MQITIAPDGEILLKGGNVCLGYLNDTEATAELIDPEGWMHTGDTGEFDADGSLRLLGRKKDIIITAAGKNIAPEAIEADLANHPLIAEAVVAGEGRRYLVALVTLDPEVLGSWAKEHHRIGDVESLSADPDLRAEIQAAIDQVNAERSHVESIRKFRVLAHGLTTEDGELTPTMKVRRAVVYEHHAEVIAELYAAELNVCQPPRWLSSPTMPDQQAPQRTGRARALLYSAVATAVLLIASVACTRAGRPQASTTPSRPG